MPCENEEFDDLANRLVGDRFSIEREIRAGAFGRVVEAHDLVLGRRVAIKVIPLRGARPKEAQALLHEARAAASAGPSAVAVYDVLSPSAGIAIVMELVQRGSLIAAARTGIARGRGIALALAVSQSVAAIHDHCILHLDLHPGSLLLRDDDSVVVTDFGLAQFAKSTGLSRGGHKKNWTAPELIGYGLASTQADVYAAGPRRRLDRPSVRRGIRARGEVAGAAREDGQLAPIGPMHCRAS